MAEYITIALKDKKFQVKRDLTEQEQKDGWRNRKTITETLDTAPARIISSRLALFQYEQSRLYSDARYHVIHIPTGLVIADVPYDLVACVKKTFESSKWTLKGMNTLVLYDDTIEFELTCKIRYDII